MWSVCRRRRLASQASRMWRADSRDGLGQRSGPAKTLVGGTPFSPRPPPPGEPATDYRLGLAAAVQIGRVEEVHARFERVVHDGEAVGLVRLGAEVHRPEAQRAHPQAGSPECSVLHDTLLLAERPGPGGPTQADLRTVGDAEPRPLRRELGWSARAADQPWPVRADRSGLDIGGEKARPGEEGDELDREYLLGRRRQLLLAPPAVAGHDPALELGLPRIVDREPVHANHEEGVVLFEVLADQVEGRVL